ncbi:MAG: tetratricopeptide repeat protein, partial [Dissulfurimicrobium sp.]
MNLHKMILYCLILPAMALFFSADAMGGERATLKEAAYASYMQATIERQEGRFDAAVNHLEQALKMDPGSVAIVKELAETVFQMGDFDRCKKWAEKAIDMDPDDLGLKVMLARCHAAQGDYDAALSILDGVLKTDPGYQDALFLQGSIYAQSNDLVKAEEA